MLESSEDLTDNLAVPSALLPADHNSHNPGSPQDPENNAPNPGNTDPDTGSASRRTVTVYCEYLKIYKYQLEILIYRVIFV